MDEVREEVNPAARVGARRSELSATRRAFFWSVIVTIGVVASLAAGEFVVRILGARPGLTQDELDRKLALSKRMEVSVVTTGNLAGLIQPSDAPGVIYELKPSRRWQFQGALTQTNEHGFRGDDWPVAKGSSTLRVVGIGDSVMFGWGVDGAATYMARLERMLQIPGRTVEVLNCAVPGYNTSQEVATLEQRCLRFEPDVILIGYCTNDWAAPFFVKDPARGGLIESSVLLDWIQERRRERARRYFDRFQGMDKTIQALRDLSALARARNIPVIFFVAPDQQARPGDQDALRDLAKELGFVDVDVNQALRREHDLADLALSATDEHPNPLGHELIANALLPAVLDALRSRLRS